MAYGDEMFRFGMDGNFICLAPELSGTFSPGSYLDLQRPTIMLDTSGNVTTRTVAPAGAPTPGGTQVVTDDSSFPVVDAHVVVPINEGITVGGMGMLSHNSFRRITTNTDYAVAAEDSTTTEYFTLDTVYKASALFAIRAFGLDIGGTIGIGGSNSPASEKFDWTVDNIANDTFVTDLGEDEVSSTDFDAHVGASRRGDPLSLGGSVLFWQGYDVDGPVLVVRQRCELVPRRNSHVCRQRAGGGHLS
jgi:hypothetical protein